MFTCSGTQCVHVIHGWVVLHCDWILIYVCTYTIEGCSRPPLVTHVRTSHCVHVLRPVIGEYPDIVHIKRRFHVCMYSMYVSVLAVLKQLEFRLVYVCTYVRGQYYVAVMCCRLIHTCT